ncbi:MAG: heavy metal translocating P-type ATPase, partial [Cyanobacteria bacterium M_surface_9_m1_291]|nr:heavy metal translocating P-type ATPase [Cyanobacteria bacterium M_surface_9_m1_291]
RAGRDSAVARIIGLVEQAQARKAPIQRLADQLAGRFTLVVLLLAAFTFVFWWQWGTQLWPQVLAHAPSAHLHGAHRTLGMGAETPLVLAIQLSIAVLVVACPCALGLATPTAISVGSGRAARAGVLFRGGDAIEAAAGLRTVLFDKTGTLTVGRPRLAALQLVDSGADEARLIQLAASLEAQTRHPLAHALLQRCQELALPLLPVQQCITHPGQGLSGELSDGGTVLVGQPHWLQAEGIAVAEPERRWLADQGHRGATAVAVAQAGRLIGLLALDDAVRSDVAQAVNQLQALGLELGLLSGDRQSAVERLGTSLGLSGTQLAWGLLPQQKLERIEAARGRGAVAMVGDGINDAPALAAADLGVAVGTGTQVAMDAADLVVLGDRLTPIPMALRLARRTMAKVRQNLAWAFGYNLVVIPIAAGVLLPGFGVLLSPPLAALLMASSSITVVVNALTLGRDA